MADETKTQPISRLVIDAIVILLLGLILAKLCQPSAPPVAVAQPPINIPSDIKFIHDQPPIIVNIPDTIKINIDTGTVEIEQRLLPEIRTIIKEVRTKKEVEDLLGIKEGDVNPLDPDVESFHDIETTEKVDEVVETEAAPKEKEPEKKKKFEKKKLLPWNWSIWDRFRKKGESGDKPD